MELSPLNAGQPLARALPKRRCAHRASIAPTRPQEPPMITAVVRFKLPADVTLASATELFKGSAPKYQNLPGLVRKYYLYGEGMGGGVYLWKSRADAEKVYTAEWRRMIADRYGAEPEIMFFSTPVIVDNETQQVQVAAA